ncbi:hypothetical protein JTE90_016406 [Oedothorax gibbosus]|uniref:Uncharacterized protein n=1 Tax=Oedothorax gibbosus TaxID=931172 RepID=A0AAV6TDT1_9ARAC|nr:hypothetical protein JTE90_016406 [Oedothorax gibbosus]
MQRGGIRVTNRDNWLVRGQSVHSDITFDLQMSATILSMRSRIRQAVGLYHPLIGKRRAGFRPSRDRLVLTTDDCRRCDSKSCQYERNRSSDTLVIAWSRSASGAKA